MKTAATVIAHPAHADCGSCHRSERHDGIERVPPRRLDADRHDRQLGRRGRRPRSRGRLLAAECAEANALLEAM